MRVRAIEVKKLFGLYDHRIDLNLDERVTIIHGPNGVGKTMVLKLLAALFAGRLEGFGSIPFERFDVHLTDGSQLTIEQTPSTPAEGPDLQLTVCPAGGEPKSETWRFPSGGQRRLSQAKFIASDLAWLDRTSIGDWANEHSGASLAGNALIWRYGDAIPPLLREQFGYPSEPGWFKETREQVSVYLIEAQRLLSLAADEARGARRSGPEPAVSECAKDLLEQIKETLANYARESQALDQTFPQRLMSDKRSEMSLEDIKKQMADLETQRRDMQDIGLLVDSAP